MAGPVYGAIYRVTHLSSGRVYIGQTTESVSKRWRNHQRQGYCVLLHRAIKKYGAEDFAVETVATADSAEQLNAFEIFWIGVHQSTNRDHGFNLREGGGSGKHSEESRQKMSEKVRLAYAKPETRERLSAALKGKKHSPERAAKVSAALTGKKASEETRRKLSEAKKKLWADPAFHERMQASFDAGKGDEWRAKVAAAAKRQWEDPEKRARAIAASTAGKKAMWADPAKRAAILKRRATSAAKKSAAPK